MHLWGMNHQVVRGLGLYLHLLQAENPGVDFAKL